jgi:hypothetical protein
METNAMSNSQPKSLGIPHHTKTIITLGGGIMTYTSYRNSKPWTSGQTWTIAKRLGC